MQRLFRLSVLVLFLASPFPCLARTWYSSDGKYSVEAELVKADGKTVTLRTTTGKIIPVPLERLSEADVAYIRSESPNADGGSATPETVPSDSPKLNAETTPELASSPIPPPPPLAKEGVDSWQTGCDAAVPLTVAEDFQPISLGTVCDMRPMMIGRTHLLIARGSGAEAKVERYCMLAGQKCGEMKHPTGNKLEKLYANHDASLFGVMRKDPIRAEIFSIETGKLVATIPKRKGPFITMASPGFRGKEAVIVRGSYFDVYDLNTGTVIEGPDINRTGVHYDWFSPNGIYLVTCESGNVLKFYDTRNGVLAGTIETPEWFNSEYFVLQKIAFTHDGQIMAGLYKSHLDMSLIASWDMTTGKMAGEPVRLSEEQHPFTDRGGYEAIQWFPDKMKWWVCGAAVIDRQSGEPLWICPEKSDLIAPGFPHPRLVGDQHILFKHAFSLMDKRINILPLPVAEIEQEATR